jgi:Domain of unknown function (DUF5671)
VRRSRPVPSTAAAGWPWTSLRQEAIVATNDELYAFVKDALGRGVPRQDIESTLRKSGWTDAQARGALAGFADLEFPIPVPRPRPYLDARDAFLYLLLFATLYISAFHLGNLAFLLIDRTWPDPVVNNLAPHLREAMRFSIASLVVATPVFLYVSMITGRAIRLDTAKRNSEMRRWLTYLTVFVASVILIGDVIALVYNLLGGDLPITFVLKVLTVAAIAGGAFSFYLWDIRADETGAAS